MDNESKIKQIVEYIKRVPTGDNMQHWVFSIDGHKVYLQHEDEFADHILNQSRISSYIALGFLLGYVDAAQKAFNVLIDVERNDLNLTLIIKSLERFQQCDKTDPYLVRYTDRRLFDSQITPEELKKVQKQFPTIKTLDMETAPSDSKKLIFANEKRTYTSVSFFVDFLKWVRFSQKDYEKRKDGMTTEQLSLGAIDVITLFIFKHFPVVIPLILKTPLFVFLELTLKKFYKNSHLIVFECEDYRNDESLIEASREVIKLWAELSRQGISTQPMNVTFLPLIEIFRNGDSSEDDVKRYANLANLFESDQKPFWVFRVGKVHKPLKIQPTLRR